MSAQPFHILCFGDSLTEGYSLFGLKKTPYSRWMKEILDVRLEGEYIVFVETDGVSGQCVVGDSDSDRVGPFERRMRAQCEFEPFFICSYNIWWSGMVKFQTFFRVVVG